MILKGILFFWDRGYGGTEGKVNTSTIEAGANIVTTCQRQNSFPFTFGQKPGPSRVAVEEYGASVCYWASKTVQSLYGKATQYALAYRNGLKCVVLMSTTIPECGPGKYAFITKSHSYAAMSDGRSYLHSPDDQQLRNSEDDDNSGNSDSDSEIDIDGSSDEEDESGSVDNGRYYVILKNVSADDDELKTRNDKRIAKLFSFFETGVIVRLTSAQRCPEWFLLRQFRITGTGAYSIWSSVKDSDDTRIHPILKAIGLLRQDDDSDNDFDDDSDDDSDDE